MARKFLNLLGIVLIVCALLGLLGLTMNQSPAARIKKILRKNGIPDSTIKKWIAVSKFETANYSSRVFKDSNNPFAIVVPGSDRLSYGEGQSIYPSIEEGVQAFVIHVLRPFKYPSTFVSIDALVEFMKSQGYFTSDIDSYKMGVKRYFGR